MFRMNWRRFALVLFLVSLFVFLVVLFTGHGGGTFGFSSELMELRIKQRNNTFYTPRRKLLLQGTTVKEPNLILGDKCSNADIVINQGATAPLPTGIPTYTVEILNVCASGCNISSIHLNCGWFSSAQLINPKMFRRLSYNDCLVNDGKPLIYGGIISFKYANTFLYPLSVSSVFCPRA